MLGQPFSVGQSTEVFKNCETIDYKKKISISMNIIIRIIIRIICNYQRKVLLYLLHDKICKKQKQLQQILKYF